jgi:hypothetical protein
MTDVRGLFMPILASVFFIGVATPSFAQTTADFDIYNGTPYNIIELWHSGPDGDWRQITGDDIVPGETSHVTFDRRVACNQMFRIDLSNGHELSNSDWINLCRTSTVMIEPDPEGGYSVRYR